MKDIARRFSDINFYVSSILLDSMKLEKENLTAEQAIKIRKNKILCAQLLQELCDF